MNDMNNELLELIELFNDLYYNKKEIMFRLPKGLTIDQAWPIVLKLRKDKSIKVSLRDQSNNKFWFVLTDLITHKLELIDKHATENFFEKVDQKIQESVVYNALIDEAFNSSVIEGAFSTKRRTKEMIEQKIPPANKSEQMIINNYKALEFIFENLHNPINEQIILDMYDIVVLNTLDDEDVVTKYRNDAICVWEINAQRPIYEAPHFSQVQELMNQLVEFINDDNDQLHPILKSCIIHFVFVYIHPFFDGNGRTARALSYMYLLKKGYNFFKFFSISSIVNEEKSKYYKAIKNVEDYESDLTYFIVFYADMIINSIVRILQDFNREYKRRIVESYLKNFELVLPKRQIKLINMLIKYDKTFIDIEEYKKKNKISYETARSDLNNLVKVGLFQKIKQGKRFVYQFVPAHELVIAQKDMVISML
ncbi:MAG: Fic family protein [Firmicutes bacterium HGW-Firmicutes-8]|nr:MAG: Fic family protein [Firmicutes bacterium HGW-Firmicutes-8]